MKKSGNIILVGFLSTLMAAQVHGQIRECMTMPMDSVRRSEHPNIGASQAFERWLASHKTARTHDRTTLKTYSIPVVVHVVHNGEAVGEGPNISAAQVLSQIEVLNEDFQKKEGTNGFNDDSVGVDTGIEFYLASTDPEGNMLAEPGIDRVNGGRAEWPKGIIQNPIESELKPATIWDPARYFNIWTVNFGGFLGRNLLGYAQFPNMSGLDGLNDDQGSALTDGIVVGYKYFGSSEKGEFPTLIAPFDLGRTTTHEVGHWLGLRHIWGDGNCFVDDYVSDTPVANEPTTGCPNMAFSCGVASMFENYMDYTNDGCMNIFTQGQLERMEIVLENSPRRAGVAEVIVGLPEFPVAKEMKIYPNPATGNVRVNYENEQIRRIKVVNAYGIPVRDYSLPKFYDEDVLLETESLQDGIYYVMLTDELGKVVAAKRLIMYE